MKRKHQEHTDLEQEETQEPGTENKVESSQEPVQEISELEKLKAEAADANDRYLRLYAEFDNYKRRTSKERVELLQDSW